MSFLASRAGCAAREQQRQHSRRR